MNKENLIDYIFYLGYGVLVIVGVAIFIAVAYMIFFYLLRFKKVRAIASDIILINEINSLSDETYQEMLIQIDKARTKYKNGVKNATKNSK